MAEHMFVSMRYQCGSGSVSTSPRLTLAPRLPKEGVMSQMIDGYDNIGEDEFEATESKTIDGAFGEDEDTIKQTNKKRFKRHTRDQIQKMERFFEQCPHPNYKQRQELSRNICLEPRQIKFWFENKRTQIKNNQEHHENFLLREENEIFRVENSHYQEVLSTHSCTNCGCAKLRMDNTRLREKVDRVSAIVAEYLQKPLSSTVLSSTLDHRGNLEAIHGTSCEKNVKPMVTELLVAAIPSRDLEVISSLDGRKNMLKLAKRMTNSFRVGVGASTARTWTTLSGTGAKDIRVMTRENIDEPGRLRGIILSAATSVWLPTSPKGVVNFLCQKNNRSKWDVLYNGGLVQEITHITNGQDPRNNVSLLRISKLNSNQSSMLILQESCTDACSSFVVYAPVDTTIMKDILTGRDPDHVVLNPSGFVILPDGSGAEISDGVSGGSLLTVALQALVHSTATAKPCLEIVACINNLISSTVDRIKASFETV